jgi:hypothetical protein
MLSRGEFDPVQGKDPLEFVNESPRLRRLLR